MIFGLVKIFLNLFRQIIDDLGLAPGIVNRLLPDLIGKIRIP